MSRYLYGFLGRLAGLPIWLLSGLLLTCWVPDGHAALADCGPRLERSRFEPQAPANGEEILEAQACLEKKGFRPEKIDGRLGPLTWAALRAYWNSLVVPAPRKPKDGLGVAYKLTQDDLNALQGGKGVVSQLETLKDKPFPNEVEFRQAAAAALKDAGVQVDRYLPVALAQVEKQIAYSLTEEAFKKLRIRNIPNEVLNKLAEIKDLGYPSREEIEAAIALRAGSKPPTTPDPAGEDQAAASPAVLRQVMRQVRQVTTYQLSEASLAALAEEPLFGKGIPPILKKLAEIRGIEYPSERLFRSAVSEKVLSSSEKGEVVTHETLDAITRQARKVHRFDAASRIEWDGDGCGCVLDDLSGETYGLFPYWQAGSGQKVNFSVLSRVGYFAVSLDNRGHLAERMHWRPDKADFINQARKHGTKVDLVIYKNDWEKWREDIAAGNGSAIDTATTHIVDAVKERLDNSIFNRNKAIFSLGSSGTPSMGDGVTLFFDDYPTDEAASLYLVKFVKMLKAKLRAENPGYFLNMLVPPEAIGEGFFSFRYLSMIVPDKEHNAPDYEAQNDVDLFLVLMEEPTSQSKKDLRQRIENRFTGANLYRAIQRRNLLRKVVPVLLPDVRDARQFEEDVSYLEDNFGGVGLWPLPVIKAGAKDAEAEISNAVATIEIAGLLKFYQVDGATPVSSLHKFVCTHRWPFRIAFDVLTLLLAGFAVLAFFMCHLRKFWERHAWYFLALVVLWVGLALAILFHDPFYTDIAKGNGPLILLLLVNLLYVAFMVINRKRLARRP